MKIIVEGPDNAGKTTFALELAKRLRACFLKIERPALGIDLMALMHVMEVANTYSGFVVTDRHAAISEPIYGPICRGKHDLDLNLIDLAYARMDVIICCRPPDAVILGTIADRPQMEGVIDNAQRIVSAYDQLWEDLHLEQRILLRMYDYTAVKTPNNVRHTVESIAKDIIEYRKAHNLV